MRLSPSAHLDTFCRDRLPPQDQWPEFRFDLPELNYPERLNCAVELLDATAARVGADRPCLHSVGGTGLAEPGRAGTWTYGEAVRRTNQLARVLTEDFGLRPGNRVLLRGPNNPWLAVAWLAVIKAGGVAVTTMALLRPREIATIVGLTQPSLALCDHRFAEDLAAGAPALTTLPYGGGRARRPDRPVRGQGRHVHRGRYRRRRRGHARVDLGHHRPAEGGHALPPGRAGHRRHLFQVPDQAAPTTSSPALPRSASPTGSAACCCSRSARARRRCSSSAPPRPS